MLKALFPCWLQERLKSILSWCCTQIYVRVKQKQNKIKQWVLETERRFYRVFTTKANSLNKVCIYTPANITTGVDMELVYENGQHFC